MSLSLMTLNSPRLDIASHYSLFGYSVDYIYLTELIHLRNELLGYATIRIHGATELYLYACRSYTDINILVTVT